MNGQDGKQPLTVKKINEILNVEPFIDSWWAYWELIPNNDENICPDFKRINDNYLNLFDDIYFEDFTTQCTDLIKEFLNR